MMLLDWTQYSRFVSNQVRDRCKKGAKETGQPARNLGEVAKPYGSMNFSNIPTSTNRGSLGSLSKQHVAESGTAAGSSMESGLDVGDQEDIEVTESQTGVVAVIDMVGYTDFIQKLADRKDISTQIIARSIEVHFATIMDVLSESGGDIVKIQSDSIICVWRFKSENDGFLLAESENEECSELISLAVLSCIKCRDLLLQTQIWALEDMSDEFKGVKLDFICGIGFGNVLDLHIGARFFRMSNLLFGTAYDEALKAVEKAKEASKKNEVFVSGNVWDTCGEYLGQYEVTSKELDLRQEAVSFSSLPLQIISPKAIPSESVAELFERSKEKILHSSLEADYSNGQLATFVNERAIRLVKTVRADKKQSAYYSGSWIETSVVTFVIKPEEVTGTLQDTANEYQKLIETVLKTAKQYEMIFHKVFITKDKDLIVQTTIIHGENETMNPQLSSVKAALSCCDMLLKAGSVHQVSIAICSGTGYEGILQGNYKSKYRLVSSCVKSSEIMATSLKFTGIVADQATFDACKNLNIHGMFKATDTSGYFEIAKVENIGLKHDFERKRRGSNAGDVPEAFSPVLAAAKAVSTEKDARRPVLIEGVKGSGKTTVLKAIEKHLQRMSFLVISAECKENQVYAHPMFPYQSILAQIIDNIDMISAAPKSTGKAEFARTQTAAAKGFNTTSDRANRLLERANTMTAKDISAAKKDAPRKPLAKESSVSSAVSDYDSEVSTSDNGRQVTKAFSISSKSGKTDADHQITKAISISSKADQRKSLKMVQLPVAPAPRVSLGDARKPSSKWKFTLAFSKKIQIHPTAEVKVDVLDKGEEIGRGQKSVFESQGVLLSRLKSRLTRVGEDLNQVLPLLNPLIQPIIEETEDSLKISPDGRTLLLAGLLVRLLDKLSESRPIAILIDDSNYMDSASWSITLNIIRKCKRILLVMTTRPCTCWRYPLMTQLNETPDSTNIILHGTTTSELYGIIKKTFNLWADNIDKGLVDTIKHKTEGRYSSVFNMISYLKDSDLLQVENNTLKAKDLQTLESQLPSDMEDLLLRNYDMIPSSDFQKFLRCASVVGRHFSLDEVATIMYEVDSKSLPKYISKLVGLLKLFDVFGLIQQRHVSHMPDQAYPYKTLYSFVYSDMREAIYNYRIPKAENQALHWKLLRFYEREIDDDNEPTFLPLICYHGQFAGLVERDDIVQHIQYLSMYGNFLCNVCESFKEVIELYTHMQTLIEANQLEEIIGSHLMSEIHIRLGHANCYGIPHEINRIQSLRHFMLATQLLDFTWPRAETEWYGLLSYEVAAWAANNFIKLFTSSSNKAQKQKFRKYIYGLFGIDDYSRDMKIIRLEHLEPILENMSKILYETDAPMVEQLGCDILVLNNAFRLGNYNSSSVRLLMSMAIKANFKGHKLLAISFADRCLGQELDSQSCASGSFFWTATGKWEIAREWIDRGIIISKKMGDFASWLMCTKEQCLLYLYEGNFPQLLAAEEERKNECKKNGFTSGALAAETTILCIQVLRGDMSGAFLAKTYLQDKYKEVSPVLRAQFQVLFAHLELANGNFMQAIDSIERMIELIPKIHYSNDTIFLCVLLSILAIRSIHDKAKAYKPRERAMSRATNNINRVTTKNRRPSAMPQFATSPTSLGGGQTKFNEEEDHVGPISLAHVRELAPAPAHGRDSLILDEISKPNLITGKKPTKRSTSEFIVRSNRDKNGEISFSYKSAKKKTVHTPAATGQKVLSETIPQIKKLLNDLLTNLAPFQNHIISEPFTILLKAMLKVYDPVMLMKTQTNDGPIALRLWVQSCVKRRIGEMKLLVALLAINCWKLSNESLEFTSDLNAGMSMLAEMGLDAELIF